MDPKAPQESRKSLTVIWRQVEGCHSTFLSPSDLRAFGIETRQVETTGDGALQLEPCYFVPHPEEVLRKYPTNYDINGNDVRRLDGIPTLEDALVTVRGLPRKALSKPLKSCLTRGSKNTIPDSR